MKRYSTSLYIREMKIVKSIRFVFSNQMSVILSVTEDFGKQKYSCKLFFLGWEWELVEVYISVLRIPGK